MIMFGAARRNPVTTGYVVVWLSIVFLLYVFR